MQRLTSLKEVWACDFEYSQPDGEVPSPICMVAKELHSGRVIRKWRDELQTCPFDCSEDSLFVAYNAAAELSCFDVLGWSFPRKVLDLYVELRNRFSGLEKPHGVSLLGCLTTYNLPCLSYDEKDTMRKLAMRGGDYTAEERIALLDYCETDVVALEALLPRMLDHIDLQRAIYRGRYMGAVARMQNFGIPIDVEYRDLLLERWEGIKGKVIEKVDREYGVYEGTVFKADRFAQWVEKEDIPWPVTAQGKLCLRQEVFDEIAKEIPRVANLATLRDAISQLRVMSLMVGKDGRNRTSLWPFKSMTGRNQPSTAEYLFCMSAWLRGLMKPPPGYSVAYVDWSQQEFGIAAAFSKDKNMMDAYASGDPYLAFAIQSKMAPPGATKATHKTERNLCKQCVLGVQYCMGPERLAKRIEQPVVFAKHLLRMHRETFPDFWKWSDAVEAHAMIYNNLKTVFGWNVHLGSKPNPRSLRNFPMQANGAEMMRLACCLLTEQGYRVCGVVHDAVLVEAPTETIHQVVKECQEIMIQASKVILSGFELRSDADIVSYPNRYDDERGRDMWKTIWELAHE